jgi:predicted esterase
VTVVDVHSVPTITHGRVLVRPARAAAAGGMLVGFHGYMENAAIQMDRLEAIPGTAAWTLVAIQGLHRFYRGRTDDVVASWMTREDRDDAIADNLAYIAAALELVPHDDVTRVVYVGFSQGVPMAFRAAIRGRDRGTAVIAVGGDVPPEILEDPSAVFPPVLLLRGSRDVEWYTGAKYDRDVAALTACGVKHDTAIYDGAHEWNGAVADAIGAFIREQSPAPTRRQHS